jgi:hypothetical protein
VERKKTLKGQLGAVAVVQGSQKRRERARATEAEAEKENAQTRGHFENFENNNLDFKPSGFRSR